MAEKNKILEHFKLVLITKSPVFIGDGNKLNKKEYIRKGQTIYVPNKQKMYHDLIQRRLIDKYEDYMLSSERADLGEWLSKQRVDQNTYLSWTDYSLVCDLESAGNGQIDMMTFIKDPYGNPYIPGSSLKGTLRTIMLSYLISQKGSEFDSFRKTLINEASNQRYDNRVKRTKYLSKEAKDIEAELLHTLQRKNEKPQDRKDAVNDLMSCLIIGDSKPLNSKDLIMCQKVDMNPSGITKPLNLARECIKPGVKIEFDVTIDLRPGYPEKQRFPFDVDTIKAAIKYFATQYYKCFFKPFKELDKVNGDITTNMIWLGGGAGYATKTIVYPMLGKDQGLKTVTDIMLKTVSTTEHRHENDPDIGVSPHMAKCTKFGGQIYEFGRCQVKIVESES